MSRVSTTSRCGNGHHMRTDTTERTTPLHSLALHGDLDLATAPLFEDRVRDLLDDGAMFVVVDVSDVNFVDSSGLRSLIHVDQLAAEHDAVIRLVGLTSAMRRLLELSGLIDRLRVARIERAPRSGHAPARARARTDPDTTGSASAATDTRPRPDALEAGRSAATRTDRPRLAGSVGDRGVGAGPEVLTDRRGTGAATGRVGHQHADQVLGGIVGPDRAEPAVPSVRARGVGRAGPAALHRQPEAPPEVARRVGRRPTSAPVSWSVVIASTVGRARMRSSPCRPPSMSIRANDR